MVIFVLVYAWQRWKMSRIAKEEMVIKLLERERRIVEEQHRLESKIS